MHDTRLRSTVAVTLLLGPLAACSSVVPIGEPPPDADGDADVDADADADVEHDAEADCSPADDLECAPESPLWLEGSLPLADGAFAVIGRMRGPVVFGDDELTIETDERELFVARFSSAGELQWVERIRGYDFINDFALRGFCFEGETGFPTLDNANIPALALADGSLLLALVGHTDLIEPTVLGVGDDDEEVIEPVAAGATRWLKYLPSGERRILQEAYAFPKLATADGGWFAMSASEELGEGDPYVLERYDADGEILWTRTVGRVAPQVVPGPDGSLVLLGAFIIDATIFDEALFPAGCDTGCCDSKIFAARIGEAGEVLWTRCLGHGWQTERIVFTDDDAVVVAAHFDPSYATEGVVFGSGDTATTWDGPDQAGVLLARIGADGVPEWVRQAVGFGGGESGGVHVFSMRRDGTAIVGVPSLATSIGDGARRVARPGRGPGAIAGFDEAGELAWARAIAGFMPDAALGDDDSTVVVGDPEDLDPFVLGDVSDGIVVPSRGSLDGVVLAALDRDGVLLWSYLLSRGIVLESGPITLADDAILEVATLRGEAEVESDAASVSLGADGSVVIAAVRIERDGGLSWARSLVSVPDPCLPRDGQRFAHLFECPASIETEADTEPYSDRSQYWDLVDELQDRLTRWLDPSCFYLCATAQPTDSCWEAACTTSEGASISALHTTVISVEGVGAEEVIVTTSTDSFSVEPPPGAETWSSIVLEYDSQHRERPTDGFWESTSSRTVRWEGSVDPAWPASYGVQLDTSSVEHDGGAMRDTTTTFSHEQCEIEVHVVSDSGGESVRTSVNGHGTDCVSEGEGEVCTIF